MLGTSNRHYMITTEQREKLRGWFAGRLPDDLFEELTEITVDREEITVIGRIPAPRLAEDAPAAEREAALESRVQEFRERTREDRMAVAREAEHRFRRKVSWGVECGGRRTLFTHVAAPVMTRLRQPERQVLDTLIAGGSPAAAATRWPGACAWSSVTPTTGSRSCATPSNTCSGSGPRGRTPSRIKRITPSTRMTRSDHEVDDRSTHSTENG
jgi:hypothetical protein